MPIVANATEVALDTIMLASDFSPSAETANLYVQSLARRYQAQIRLMHVIDLSAGFEAPDAGLCIDNTRSRGSESLARAAGRLVSARLTVQTILCEAMNPTAAILHAAKNKYVSLLVIGTHGHTGKARLVPGSTAEELIQKAECPILTIGPGVRPPKDAVCFRSILYATDFSPGAAKAGAFGLSLARDYRAHIDLCHVLPAANSQTNELDLKNRCLNTLQRMVPRVARERCEPEFVVERGDTAEEILLLAERRKADLIVLGSRRSYHSFDNVRDEVTFKVISGSTCPVLTVRG